ncbi:MAG: hypothetical protein WC710_15035 [Gallionella sp.]
MITCYAQPDKLKSWRVLEAFAAGCKGKLACTTSASLAPGGAAFYGVRPAWQHLWQQAQDEQRETFYLDNSWFDTTREAFFRIGHNAVQSWSSKPSDGKRLSSLGIQPKPWNKRGKHIIVCPQSDEFMRFAGWGQGRAGWLQHVTQRLEKFTERKIIVRSKRDPRPLAAQLQDAWLLVAHSSAAAVEALIAGVPVILTDRDCAAASFSSAFPLVETPRYPEGRAEWLARLADSQWTETELKNGTAWRKLHE